MWQVWLLSVDVPKKNLNKIKQILKTRRGVKKRKSWCKNRKSLCDKSWKPFSGKMARLFSMVVQKILLTLVLVIVLNSSFVLSSRRYNGYARFQRGDQVLTGIQKLRNPNFGTSNLTPLQYVKMTSLLMLFIKYKRLFLGI